MTPRLTLFPSSVPITTEVRVHLTFFAVQKSVNLLFVKQCRFLLPTLPVTCPFFLKLLAKVAVPFRSSCLRLTRTSTNGKFVRRGFDVCRIRFLNRPSPASVLEIMIDVSPPIRRQSATERRKNGSGTPVRKPVS